MYNLVMDKKLSTWLNKKLQEWEWKKGRRQSVSEFARYLDVKQPSLTRWMAGDNPPTGGNLKKLADKLGVEIYEVLGLPRPEVTESELADRYNVPPENKAEFIQDTRKFIEQWFLDHGWKLINGDDPKPE